MAAPKTSCDHVENHDHEAVLTGTIALASLFSNCVEAFGLIHPAHKWEKEEQLLLTKLGLQQARLLIWGDVLGISSPPKSVTDRAVPRYPSSAYPDLNEPTFFAPRDDRLDMPETRTEIENTLSSILDRPKAASREDMMSKFGLKPPKRVSGSAEPALDTNRLEAFRERWELLQEVAESYARLNTRRANSILHNSWQIAECHKFADFIKLTQEKVDHLIMLMDVKDRVDRGIRMDIRGFGWHIAPDRSRTAQDTSKLRLLQEICAQDYPEYVVATKQALEQIKRETRENLLTINPYVVRPTTAPTDATDSGNGGSGHAHEKRRSAGFFGLFKSRGKDNGKNHSRRDSGLVPPAEPARSLSDSGPTTAAPAPSHGDHDDEDQAPLGRVRSKSVGAWIDAPPDSDEEDLRNQLEQMDTVDDQLPSSPPRKGSIAGWCFADPIRHDQYKGIARTATKDLHQADF